jgi:Fur family ferric uptake transcriptional regulator
MKDQNVLEKANLRALLETDQVDRVQDRLNIVDTFLDTEDHVTLEELFRLLKENGYDYEPSFVRQCMSRMVELGFVQRKRFEDQPIRYEHRHLGRHHDHLICTKCGKIVEFSNDELERLQVRIATSHGFHMLQHRMEIYGLCDECLAQRAPLVPLSMAKPGEWVEVKEISTGAGGRSRLASMGLRIGDRLEIISNDGHGRLILGHDCSRLAMGRGIAQKILVSLSTLPNDDVCKEKS